MEDILIGHGVRIGGRDYRIIGVTGGDVYADGGPSVFDVFDTTPYIFLRLADGVAGKTITAEYMADGVYKLRTGVIRANTSENVEQGATLHIKPTESFLDVVPSNREHYTLTLVDSDFSEYVDAS
ncbi:hypothetical protein EOL73_03810 [Candidatus Saccharibacteria bacterium]|nr:hypothetical protein [Candidatus Saccharibacteria bacterium]